MPINKNKKPKIASLPFISEHNIIEPKKIDNKNAVEKIASSKEEYIGAAFLYTLISGFNGFII